MITSDYNRSGGFWSNGRYIRSVYLTPALNTIFLNFKRLIDNEQNTFVPEAAAIDGVDVALLPREDPGYFFNTKSIHTGVSPDSNSLACWIDINEGGQGTGLSGKDLITFVDIYSTIGAGDWDNQVCYQSIFLRGIVNMCFAMPLKELLFGWPANVAANKRGNYVLPDITLKTTYKGKPDVTNAQVRGSQISPISKVSMEITFPLVKNVPL